jgi:hypothetical protein
MASKLESKAIAAFGRANIAATARADTVFFIRTSLIGETTMRSFSAN